MSIEKKDEKKDEKKEDNEPRFGHPDHKLDTDPPRYFQPIKRASALSTASASALTLSTW